MIFRDLLKAETLKIAMIIATTVGAFGGFPEPPRSFMALTKYQLVQWFLVFVLVFQGGAEGHAMQALGATVLSFVLYKVVRYLENRTNENELE